MKAFEVQPTHQLTFNRMREVNMWSRAFALLQWCLVPCLLLFLCGLCNVVMWRLGETAALKYPDGGRVAERDVLYASWRVPIAVFDAAVGIVLTVILVRWATGRFWPDHKLFRPWLNPAVATFDFFKLILAMTVMIGACFYATFLAEYQFPALPHFLKPPSTVMTTDGWTNFREWLGTRGIQFVFVAVLSVLAAQRVLYANRDALVPRSHRIPIFAAYVVGFEFFYYLADRVFRFLFYGTYEQAQSLLLAGSILLLGVFLLTWLFAGAMWHMSRNIIRPDFPVDCYVVLAGASEAGKTRFFGEALNAIRRLPRIVVNVLGDTAEFADQFERNRLSWNYSGTSRPDRYTFSIEKLHEVIRFHWQDIPGGIPARTMKDPEFERAWQEELHSANALCIFFDAEKLDKQGLKGYERFENLRLAAITFIRELQLRNDFERPPIICIIATRVDRIKSRSERKIKNELESFADECRGWINDAGLPRGYVTVRLTSTMINMRGTETPKDMQATKPALPNTPEPRNCGETLMWVAAKILEAKSLGLDGPAAAIRGKATKFGELQIDMEEFAS